MAWKILTLFALLVACGQWHRTAAICDVCQINGAACVNLTSFHLCFGDDKPHRDQLFTCGDGLVCTDLPDICFQRTTRPASCGDTVSCGRCNHNQVFGCTSRTTFALCFGAPTISNVVGTCPVGMMCDASSDKVCVDQLDRLWVSVLRVCISGAHACCKE